MLRDLSYRYKIPLAFTGVILLTALALASTTAVRTYESARSDLLASAEGLGAVLASALADPIRKDAVWPAYLSIQGLASAEAGMSDPLAVVVADGQGRVFVSSRPDEFPILARLEDVGLAAGSHPDDTAQHRGRGPAAVEDEAGDRLLMMVPIEFAGTVLGRVILIYPRSRLLPPLYENVRGTVWATVLVLLALVPLGWAWGSRVAAPLVHLADGLSKVTTVAPEEIALPRVRSHDEIGRLTGQFRTMLRDLREKREVERRMVATERLAALGRLSAGVAHEINNPLGGMLTALSTYRRHGIPHEGRHGVRQEGQHGGRQEYRYEDRPEGRHGSWNGGREALSLRTVSLLERGLQQIRETVSALLVEARLETHPLSAHDIEDVRTLVLPEVHKKNARLEWASEVNGPMALPSTQVRQVLINLLLNAIEAVDDGGVVGCDIRRSDERLRITIDDDGDPIPDDHVEHLFEPFARHHAGGSGLGLWVTWQIVQQFKGELTVDSQPGLTRFRVELPIADAGTVPAGPAAAWPNEPPVTRGGSRT